MLLLVDENVPASVVDFFRERGHEVVHILSVAMQATEDPIVSAIGDELHAVIVTWNARDFTALNPRIPKDNVVRFRHLGRINFKCKESRGRQRAEQLIEEIEFHYAQAQKRRDKRLMIDILDTKINVIM